MKRYACIFVGTSRCSLRVAQRGAGGRVNIIDKAEYPVEFDARIFREERQRERTVTELTRVIREYIGIAEQNSPEKIDIFMSAALRRAIDSVYIYERIRQAIRPYHVSIISDEKELLDFCKSMMVEVLKFMPAQALKEESLFINIKGDGTLLGYLKDGFIEYITRIPLGYAKLGALMETIIDESETFGRLLTEITTNYLLQTETALRKHKIKNIYVSTNDFPAILAMSDERKNPALTEALHQNGSHVNHLYQSVKELTPKQIARKYPKLRDAGADTVLYTLVYSRALLDVFSLNSIYFVPSDFAGGIASFEFKQTMAGQISGWIERSGYQCARAEAKRYGVDLENAGVTEYYALRFFDTLKKSFGMTKRLRYLMRISAILSPAGYFFGDPAVSGADEFIVKNSGIVGLSERERFLAGRICAHAMDKDYTGLPADADLTEDEQLMVAQAASIIKLAMAMNASRKNKIENLKCQLKGDSFTVKGTTTKNVNLELYDYKTASPAFEQIFGLKTSLIVKRVRL